MANQKVSGIKVNHSKETKEKFKVTSKLVKKGEIDKQINELKAFYIHICKDIKEIRESMNFDTVLEAVDDALSQIKDLFDKENDQLCDVLVILAFLMQNRECSRQDS